MSESVFNPVSVISDKPKSPERTKLAIDIESPSSIMEYGQECTKQIGVFADQVLSLVKASDTGEFGKKLANVLVLTKSMDFNSLSASKPASIMDKISGFFTQKKEEVRSHFESVSTQIDRLLSDLAHTKETLKARVEALDKLYELNKQEFDNLQIYIDNGTATIQELKNRAVAIPQTDPFAVNKSADLNSLALRLEKRVSDLKIAQTLALQTAPEIRVIQSNSQTLISKLDDISCLTIPAWKKQFILAISISEQQSAAKIANAVDDTTNAIIRENASLLHDNSVAIAKSNQRQLVDLDTLQFANTQLVESINDIARINEEGENQRKELGTKLESMKNELASALSGVTKH